jgi:hypothetical protein
MSVKTLYLEVGFDKNGHAEFGVPCSISELSYDEMTQLRAMVTVAIGTMEQMWRDANMRRQENQASQASPNAASK